MDKREEELRIPADLTVREGRYIIQTLIPHLQQILHPPHNPPSRPKPPTNPTFLSSPKTSIETADPSCSCQINLWPLNLHPAPQNPPSVLKNLHSLSHSEPSSRSSTPFLSPFPFFGNQGAHWPTAPLSRA